MLFSILVPIYNMEKYLPECLESIIEQKYSNYEIILVDDGSTDGSGRICDDFCLGKEKICKVVHKTNGGLMSARRKAFELAEGEYCICLDADDFLADGALAHLAKIIAEFTPDFILHDLYLFKKKGNYVNINSGKKRLKEQYLYKDTHILKDDLLNISYNNWSMAAKCIKTTFAQTKYDFKPYYNISYGEDTIQSIVLYNEASNFVYTSQRIYNYRLNTGMTSNFNLGYLDDFYKISRFMVNECCEWSENIEYSSNLYFMLIVQEYIKMVVYSGGRFKQIRQLLNEVNNNKYIMNIQEINLENLGNSQIKRVYNYLKSKKYINIYIYLNLFRGMESIRNKIMNFFEKRPAMKSQP